MTDSIDLVFVSNNTKPILWEMTANAIRTATTRAGMKIGKVITVEQCRTALAQTRGRTLYYDVPFNYNWCLNLGRSFCKSKYVAFCNNDLIFETNWAKNAIEAMQEYGYLSVSPAYKFNSNTIIEGYTIAKVLLGWCIITDQRVFDYIGKFDEAVNFWYSDDVYAAQLIDAGIKHALIGTSRVKHLGSRTLTKISGKVRAGYMRKQRKIFDQYKLKKYANTSTEVKD